MKAELASKFFDTYGQQPAATYFTPGRVNLIGEHIDYNGGLVLPCAITLGTWLAVAPNNDNVIRFKSLNFPEEAKINIQDSKVRCCLLSYFLTRKLLFIMECELYSRK